jgi:1,4-dihydroxy-2-naphthoyl-CoA synthase
LSHVRTEVRDGVAVLTLDRPKANAFSPELVADISSALTAHATLARCDLVGVHGDVSPPVDLPLWSTAIEGGWRS